MACRSTCTAWASVKKRIDPDPVAVAVETLPVMLFFNQPGTTDSGKESTDNCECN